MLRRVSVPVFVYICVRACVTWGGYRGGVRVWALIERVDEGVFRAQEGRGHQDPICGGVGCAAYLGEGQGRKRETGQAKGGEGAAECEEQGDGRGQEGQGMCVGLVLGRLAGGDCIDVCDCELLTEMGRAPQNGSTPLICAAFTGQSQVVQELLAKGADIEAKDKVRGGAGCMIGAALRVCACVCVYLCAGLCDVGRVSWGSACVGID